MTTVKDQILPFLTSVRRPTQYLGNEFNVVRKDPGSVEMQVCLAFPDEYRLGMSNVGLRILYKLINDLPWAQAQRAFAPELDMAEALRERSIPLFGLEQHTPLKDFDIVGLSLQTELLYTSSLYLLDLGQIPLLSEDRTDDHPIVIAGGHAVYNPEPLADFIDMFVIGDGEEPMIELMEVMREQKQKGITDRHAIIAEAVRRIEGLYAPEHWEASFGEDGLQSGLERKHDWVPKKVHAAVVEDLDSVPYPTDFPVSSLETVHDRISIEIMRGCVEGCRFCQAGYIKRPLRVRSPEKVVEIAKESYRKTGYAGMSLTSLSSSAYPYLREVVEKVEEEFKNDCINVGLPSLRVDHQVEELPRILKTAKKTGLTLAPEVATDRLRRVINKPILNEDLYKGTLSAFEQDWEHVKLYFLMGVPTEERSDLDGMVDMSEHVSKLRQTLGRGPARVNTSVSVFVPKPFTPFQWDPMMDRDTTLDRQQYLRGKLQSRQVKLSFHDVDKTWIESILARGDRALGPVILQAYRNGAFFDNWSDRFDLQGWKDAFEVCGIDGDHYAYRSIPFDGFLPWDHIKAGVSKRFLIDERLKANAEAITEECQRGPCAYCGVPPKTCFHPQAKLAVAQAD
ncbi:MAG: TIGR03960 family B12-binding radical SAM protein [Planctomycetota bacterium]